MRNESMNERELLFERLALTSSKKITDALSELTGEKTFVEFCEVKYAKVEEKTLIIDANERCFGVYSTVSQPVKAVATVFFPARTISKLLALVRKRYGQKNGFSHEMRLSAFKEISNIIVSTYLSEFGNLLNAKVVSSPPKLIYFKTVTLAKNVSSKNPLKTSNLVLIGKFHEASNTVEGKLVLIFDLSSFDELLETQSRMLPISPKT